MGVSRNRTVRDAILLLLGATCMHIASNFMGPFTDNFTGDIIVNTHFDQQHPIHEDTSSSDSTLTTTTIHHTVPEIHYHDDDISTTPIPPSTPSPPLHVDLFHELPETTLEAHAPGWTMFRNVYMSNGTLYIVTPKPASSFPDIQFITSTGLAAENTPENIAARMPTAENLDFITPEAAKARWGPMKPEGTNRVWSVEGNTFLFNDPNQFLDHYYHFCAELLFGAWAFWSGAHNAMVEASNPFISSAPPVHRAIFAHTGAEGWRDRPGFNSYFLRAAFPSLTVEIQRDWEDRIASTSSTGKHARAWHFDKLLLADRSASFRGEVCGSTNQRTAGEAYHHMFKAGNLTKYWWEPIRRSVLRFGGVDDYVLDKGIREAASDVATLSKRQDVVITYVSRQGVRRHLIEEDHDDLVFALGELCALNDWELNVVQAERLTKEQQVSLVAKTTILIGVHGNGLTHLILMSPTPISAVIELFYPGGFAHDYEWTTRAMGMKHFAIQNDTYYTHPVNPWVNYPEGFQGTEIPVYAPTVVEIIEDRVAGRLPNSDFFAPIERLNT
ncbi:hypothetical protein C8Q75DRAFT_856968 [Abortiporus biennis]|nr:hypothetical protein C8Q75DRAFT_856968 [Abortiporus biennis]